MYRKGSSGTTKKLITVVGGCVGLLIIGLIFINFLGSSEKTDTQMFLGLAQQQQEIIRVAGLGLAQPAASPDTINHLLTTQLTMQSSQKDILALLNQKDPKKAAKELALKQDLQTDTKITTAVQNGVFDKTFIQILDGQLATYSNSLQTAYKSSKKKAEKDILMASFNDVKLLLNDPSVKN